MKNQRGFSLVEIMIAVAIVSVIAIVGGASYQKAMKQAKVNDMKVALGIGYSAEQTFAKMWSSYTYCLVSIHGIPDVPGTRTFMSGFWNGEDDRKCGAGEDESCFSKTFNPSVLCSCAQATGSGHNDCTAMSTTDPGVAPNVGTRWLVRRKEFTIGGAVNVGNIETWTIDQGKVLTRGQIGF